jgi:hypothetical protein
MKARRTETHSEARRLLVSWMALLAGPIACAVQLQLVYALAIWACGGGKRLPMHLATLLCLLAATTGAWMAWGELRTEAQSTRLGMVESRERAHLMAVVSLMSGSLFALVILAQWIAVMLLEACPT